MQNYCKIIGAMAALSALVAGNAQAEVSVNYDLHAGYSTDYLFRGTNLGTDLVEAGFDASSEVGSGITVSAGAWYGDYTIANGLVGNLLQGRDVLAAKELDLYAEASKDFGFATASIGYIYYDQEGVFDEEDLLLGGQAIGDSQEVYFSLSRDFGFVTAALTYYWDVAGQVANGDNDGYTTLEACKSFELTQCLTLNTGATLGYLAEEGHLAHLTTKVSLDYGFAEHAKVSPYVAASWDLSGGHGAAYQEGLITDNAKNELVGGVMVSASF